MTKLHASLFVAGLAFVGAAGAHAQDASAQGSEAGVRCEAAGYDVLIYNDRAEPLPIGTEVGWDVPFIRKQGSHVLTREVAPGGSAVATAVLGSLYLVSKRPCTATVAD